MTVTRLGELWEPTPRDCGLEARPMCGADRT
jgi:hypothetical protein